MDHAVRKIRVRRRTVVADQQDLGVVRRGADPDARDRVSQDRESSELVRLFRPSHSSFTIGGDLKRLVENSEFHTDLAEVLEVSANTHACRRGTASAGPSRRR